MVAECIIRNDGFRHQVRPRRVYARVDVLTVIAIWPPIEAVLFHGCEVVRDKIAADFIPFVHDGPQFPVLVPVQGDGIAQARRINTGLSAFNVDLQNRRPAFFLLDAILGDIAVRSD